MSTSALAAGKRLVGDVQAHDLNHADEVLYAFIDAADIFAKLYSFPVDSFIYGQPLYVPNMQIAGGTHNVVFAATENGSIYAFDAGHKTSTPLWHTFIDTPVPCSANQPAPGSNCNLVLLTPGVGITSAPTIDPVQGTHGAIYVEGRTNPGKGDAWKPKDSQRHGFGDGARQCQWRNQLQ